ncbi:hypothetical protein CSC86_10105 [Staphylococcus aureus]|nr:hypothetical protein [Staphylococcus aureus]PPJ92402.1 hypothetical protein CSC86_10105 [Staphylococcus aureus]
MTTNYYVESIKLKMNFIMNMYRINCKKQILNRILY